MIQTNSGKALDIHALEELVQRNLNESWFDAGEALAAIHQEKLWRSAGAYATFESYLESRWKLSRQAGYDLLHATEVQRNVRICVQIPIPQSFARALYGLSHEQQIELARRIADEHITYLQLQQLVERARFAHRFAHNRGAFEDPEPAPTENAGWQIEQADAADPPFSDLDLIVNSPPYGCIDPDQARALDYIEYPDFDQYRREQLPRWARGMYRAAAPWGRLAIVVAVDISRPRRAPLAAHWQQALEDAGWHFRYWYHWWEGNVSRQVARGTMDARAPNVICPMEAILVYHKGPAWNLAEVRKAYPERWGRPDLTKLEWLRVTKGVWEIPGQRASDVGGFPAAYPPQVANWTIKLLSFPRAKVADFFLGSGTTAEVSIQTGRQFFGCELSARWVDYSRRRAAAALLQPVSKEEASVNA